MSSFLNPKKSPLVFGILYLVVSVLFFAFYDHLMDPERPRYVILVWLDGLLGKYGLCGLLFGGGVVFTALGIRMRNQQ